MAITTRRPPTTIPQLLLTQVEKRFLARDYFGARTMLETLQTHLETEKQKEIAEDLSEALEERDFSTSAKLLNRLIATY